MRRFPLGMARDRMPDDVEPSQAELLRVEARHEGAGAIVKLAGELAYSTAERFVACILEVLDQPDKYRGDIEAIRKAYNPDSIAAEYEKLFERLMK